MRKNVAKGSIFEFQGGGREQWNAILKLR